MVLSANLYDYCLFEQAKSLSPLCAVFFLSVRSFRQISESWETNKNVLPKMSELTREGEVWMIIVYESHADDIYDAYLAHFGRQIKLFAVDRGICQSF